MFAPDETGEQSNGNANQGSASKEIFEARTLDDEARGARRPTNEARSGGSYLSRKGDQTNLNL
jgi:hypothetical protein